MQDKGIVNDGEEVKHQDKKEAPTKDGKAFAFRKMKQSKKDKSESRKTTNSKNSPSKGSYEGEGVAFKAKLIGLESIPDARGDKMCQEAMIKLKVNVKNSGMHKKKINICVSLQGIKIKEEKTGVVLYHHPVNLISFISQDITDARAFGYVFGSSTEPHQFIAIKTDKPAFHVVLALRDLFQTVLSRKQEAIDNVKEQKKEETIVKDKLDEKVSDTRFTTDLESMALDGTKSREENIYFEVLMTEPLQVTTEDPKEPTATIDDLLGLESEMNQLKEGINSMDTSIAAAAAFNSEMPENDPFDTSFVLRPKRDSFTMPMPTPVPAATTSGNISFGDPSDKYAVFSAVDTNRPSIFEKPVEAYNSEELLEDGRPEVSNLAKYSSAAPPPKPPRTSKDLSVFADLDPLGKDRPYKDKTEFFQDVKNPPKKENGDESPYATIVKKKVPEEQDN